MSEDHPSNEILYTELTNTLSGIELDIPSLISIVPKLMKLVNEFKDLNGSQKKSIVIYSIEKYIDNKLPSNMDILQQFINVALPPMIDTFIDIDKQKIAITVKSWFDCC